MNKTVTMNLSGIIFHIEEDAYEKLGNYLRTIKSYFKDSDGRDEIMGDIESRIAEMLQDKVSATKQVVLMTDVDYVISVMGKPEEFAGDSTEEKKSEEKKEEATSATFGGKKRVFRDPDEKVLGGVCSGIAAYFDIDPIWLRLGFAISFFIFGTGFLLYLILWIVMPKAKTTAEKLQMRGESVNINNIKRTFDEELEQLKKNAKDFKEEASNLGSKENKAKAKDFVDKSVEFVTDVFGGLFKWLARVIAVFFIFIGIIVLIGLISSVFGDNNTIHVDSNGSSVSYSVHDLFSSLFVSGQQMNMAMIGFALFFGIPFLALVYKGVKMLFRIKTSNRIVSIVSSVLWLSGLLTLVYVGVNVGKEFSEEASVKQVMHLRQSSDSLHPATNTIYLKVKPNSKYDFDNEEGYESRVSIGKWNVVKMNEHKINFGFPQLDILPSETDSFELEVILTAMGATKKEAVSRARNIDYWFTQEDSVLVFNPHYEIVKEDKWRAQEVQLVLRVPRNKMVYLGKDMKHIIYDVDNVTDTHDRDMVGRRWKMTFDGLACVDCDGLERKDNYGKRKRHGNIIEYNLNEDHMIEPPVHPEPPRHEHGR